MLKLFFARLRELIWPAVLSTLLVVTGIVVALVSPGSTSLVVSLGAGAVALAILAQRA